MILTFSLYSLVTHTVAKNSWTATVSMWIFSYRWSRALPNYFIFCSNIFSSKYQTPSEWSKTCGEFIWHEDTEKHNIVNCSECANSTFCPACPQTFNLPISKENQNVYQILNFQQLVDFCANSFLLDQDVKGEIMQHFDKARIRTWERLNIKPSSLGTLGIRWSTWDSASGVLQTGIFIPHGLPWASKCQLSSKIISGCY